MRKRGRISLAVIAIMALSSCASLHKGGPRDTGPKTVLEVENDAAMDMNIYVLAHATNRVRLGTAVAHITTNLTIPPDLLFGISTLRFIADPIGGSALPVSQEISVQPGDTIRLQIPPYGGQ